MRAYAYLPQTVDVASRSFGATLSTENPVVRCIPDPRLPVPTDPFSATYIEVDEILLASGVDLSRAIRMPYIDCHDVYGGVSKILGRVDDIRTEGQSIVGTITLSKRHADLLDDIVDGIACQLSIGYDYCMADAEFVEREGMRPALLVKRWLLTEVSNVPVGADPDAFIRNRYAAPSVRAAAATPSKEKPMTPEELIAAAEDAATAADAALEAAEEAVGADGTAEELVERVKTLRGKRAEEDTTTAAEDEQKPKPNPDAETEGERAEEEMTDEEKKDVENVRSIAKGYGLEKLVTDMRALGSKPAQIRAAVSKSIAERGAPAASDPVVVKTAVRSAVESFNPSAVYAARNKR